MKKVKITVLRTMLNQDLAEEYGVDGLTACPMLREGQTFYADYAKPEGLCDEAWKAMPLLWPTARIRSCFIMATGSKNPA